MKTITKSQLIQIIREEILNELSYTSPMAKTISKSISKGLSIKESDIIVAIANQFSGVLVTANSRGSLNKVFMELRKLNGRV
ncbi:hypothetical protein H8D04_00105 [bacterium]|nr:hypothetical protein [bacterium]